MTEEKDRHYTSGPVVVGPTIEYAMLVVEPNPARQEKPGDVILLGSGNKGRKLQEIGLTNWRGWAPMERVITPWVVSGRFDLVEGSSVTVPERNYDP